MIIAKQAVAGAVSHWDEATEDVKFSSAPTAGRAGA